jgi:hypothetical protein
MALAAARFVVGPASLAGLPSLTPNNGGRPGTARHIMLMERGRDRRR